MGSTGTMPCATIHLVLADRVLDDWRRNPRAAPFDVTRPELREAFVHGALAPDMGFVPGVDRFVSELAHYLRPADLTRALGELASTTVDEAFSWGWVTHVLGDVELHPLVGRAVGERLYGDRERRVDAQEDVATHVSTEVGLDLAFLRRNPGVTRPPRSVHFDGGRIGHLVEALTSTYSIRWDGAALVEAHRRAVRMCRRWPAALRSLGLARPVGAGWRPPGFRRFASASLSLAASFAREGSPARGFLTAASPPGWLVDEVDTTVEAFPELVAEVVRSGYAAIPNRNLETGGPAGPGRGHPATDAVAQKLEAARREEFQTPARESAAPPTQ